MIKWGKYLPVFVALIAVLTLSAVALSGVDSPRDLEKQRRAAENSPLSVSASQPISPELEAKAAMEAELEAKLQAEAMDEVKGGEPVQPVKPEWAVTKDRDGGANALTSRVTYYEPRAIFLQEDFETATFPPVGWDTINTNPGWGWFLGTYSGGGTQSALCTWDHDTPILQQDEWLITPAMDLSAATSLLRLEFDMLKGYSYPHDFKVYVSFDGTNFTEIWDSYSVPYPTFVWYPVTVDLSTYAGQSNVYLAFQYYGYDADLFGMDNVVVTDDGLPVGRCCSGDPLAPDCADLLQSECDALGGDWAQGLNCTDNPCPIAGPADNCAEVTPQTLPYQFTGNNEGATFDTYCQYFVDYPNNWIAFTITECSDVTISYCNTAAGWLNGWLNLVTDCACPEGSLISGATYDFLCGNGNANIYFDRLEPGTYYYPIMLDPTNGAIGDYVVDVTASPCPPAPENDACASALEVGDVTNLPYSTESASHDGLGTYMTGPNIWYTYTATCDGNVTVSLCGSAYDTRVAVYAGTTCDPLGAVVATDDDACDPGLQSFVVFAATIGQQFLIEVGGYSTAVGTGVLTISCAEVQPGNPGDNCADPIKVDIPGFPYVDNGQYTCGRINDYSTTCLGSYDGGEDVIYEVSVLSPVMVNIEMDPLGTTWTGIALSTDCPPTNCLRYVTGSSGTTKKRMTCVNLTPGVYYLMVDTWPSPNCVPAFNLRIYDTTCTIILNDACASATEVGEVTNLAFSTVGTSHDGPTGCMTAPNIWYAYKPTGPGKATISLCGSAYDTKLAVYTGTCGALTQLACNDDACGSSSQIVLASVDPAVTYLVEVGGYSSNTGTGVLNITLAPPCTYTCTGGTPEGETCIVNEGVDNTNGGCNSTPAVFGEIALGEKVCGTISTYTVGTGNRRDTDWYLLTLDDWYVVTMSGNAKFPYIMGFIEQITPGIATCDNITGYISPYIARSACVAGSVSTTLPPGDYILFFSDSVFTGHPCSTGPWEYELTVTGVPTEPIACAASGGCDEFIETVTIGTINNTTGCDEYADYTAMSTMVELGGSYPITIVNGNGYSSDQCGVWVDWNDNLLWDAGEQVTLDVGTGVGPYTGNIVVPANAVQGDLLMRVRITYTGALAPCGVTTYGEVEDYTLTTGTPPPTYMVNPDPILVLEKFAVTPHAGHLYVSDAAMGGGAAADMENVTMAIDGCPVTVMGTNVMVGGVGELTGDVMDVSFNMTEYVLCAETENGGLIWGNIDSFFDVFYEISAVPGQMDDMKAVVRGHIAGDLNLDNSVNVGDLTFMVNYLFRGGAAPLVVATANVNGSATPEPNVADLTYMVNFMFKGGAPLQHP